MQTACQTGPGQSEPVFRPKTQVFEALRRTIPCQFGTIRPARGGTEIAQDESHTDCSQIASALDISPAICVCVGLWQLDLSAEGRHYVGMRNHKQGIIGDQMMEARVRTGTQPATTADDSETGTALTGGQPYVDYATLYLDILREALQ